MEGDGIGVFVRSDGPQPVPVIALSAQALSRLSPVTNRMCVIESDRPCPVRRVEGQGVAETVRPFRRDFCAPYDEFHPVPGLVHEQGLTVKIEKHIETPVAVEFSLRFMLSINDNMRQGKIASKANVSYCVRPISSGLPPVSPARSGTGNG